MHAVHEIKSLPPSLNLRKDDPLGHASHSSAVQPSEYLKNPPEGHSLTKGLSLGVILRIADPELVGVIVDVALGDGLGETELDALTEGLVDWGVTWRSIFLIFAVSVTKVLKVYVGCVFRFIRLDYSVFTI